MKTKLVFFAFFIEIISCVGQRGANPCSRKLYLYTDNPSSADMLVYSNDLDTFIYKYISQHFYKCLGDVTSDKSDLIEVPIRIRLQDYLFFKTNEPINISIKIEHKRQKISLKSNNLDLIQIDTSLVLVDKINSEPFFGIVQSNGNDTIFVVNFINNIEAVFDGNIITVNQDLYKDLINPNLYHQYKSYRPVEAYYSISKSAIYIYIYGDVPDSIPADDFFGQNSSFLCKLIIASNGETRRIVIPTRYLKYYGWVACEDFWGF